MNKDIFTAGAAREITTPEIGTFLYGYRPDNASTCVNDDLSVTALAVSQNGQTALMLTAEIGDIQTALCNELAGRIAEECGIDKKNILISSTHTHSAPNLSGVVGWGDIDTEYYNGIFEPAAIRAAKNALASLAPAEIAIGTTESKVGINRRQQHPNGEIGLGQNPHGCYDPTMTVLSIRNSETKEGILNLIHYGCHGTSAGVGGEITRDWSGIMIDRVQAETGTLTAFWNGAIGDVGPRLTNGETTGNIKFTNELGGVAAFDAMRAYRSKGGYHPGRLEVISDKVSLPRKSMPCAEEVKAKLDEYTEPEKLINIQRLEYEHYKAVYEHLKNGGNPHADNFEFEQTLVSLGDVIFIPFPFEMFSEIALRLREYSDYPYTLSLSCTNGYTVYLPSEDQLCRGGYEVGCFRFGSLFPLADNTDQHIIAENLRIMNKMR
ncbi:MAG: neutral/alkaline non-lysosomal ceramidase N-terminal domain-containing protein [Clostridia bacterium]|nr:neutral/alkaline non-lysosomal ceramidase N-terminal domain-containing protein [Clostridia bacterium]